MLLHFFQGGRHPNRPRFPQGTEDPSFTATKALFWVGKGENTETHLSLLWPIQSLLKTSKH